MEKFYVKKRIITLLKNLAIECSSRRHINVTFKKDTTFVLMNKRCINSVKSQTLLSLSKNIGKYRYFIILNKYTMKINLCWIY